MIKVVLIVSSFPKPSETFIINKFLGLLKLGWDVHIVCQKIGKKEWAKFFPLHKHHDIYKRVHRSWPHRPRWLAALLFPVALINCLIQKPECAWFYIRRGWKLFGADVIRKLYLDAELILLEPTLLHFEFGSLAVERMYLKKLLSCQVAVSFRGYDLNYIGLENPNYYHEVWNKADGLHFLGSDLWQRAQRRGCPSDKLYVLIPPAIDKDFFDPDGRIHTGVAGTLRRPLRILSVGRLEWKKGYEYGLQAVKRLSDIGIYFEYRIIGDGQFLEALSFARHQLGLDNVVHFLGVKSHSEIKSHMCWADVFLHPAVSEGFCNAVIEAQAMKLPVVCTDADGLSENIVNGETGFVVPRRDPQAMAEKLVLMQDPVYREKIGRQGQERVKSHFRLNDQLMAFEELYRRICSSEK